MKKMKTIKKDKRQLSLKMVVLTLLLPLFGISQQLTPVLIGTTGGGFSNGNLSVDFSVGESVTGFLTGNGMMLYQGFQQGILNSTGIKEEIPTGKQIIIYPNPVTIKLFAKSNLNVSEGKYVIKNIQGQTLSHGTFSQIYKGINLENVPTGTYLITFYIHRYQPVNKIFIKQ